MQTQSFLDSGILQITDVFDPSTMAALVAHVENTVIQFEQKYPKRLFSTPAYQDVWMNYFDPVLKSIFGGYSIQQSFLGYEMPQSHFSYHKSHPGIGAICIFNLDTFSSVNLRVMNSSDIELNYANPDQFRAQQISADRYTDFDFLHNQMLVIKNQPVSRTWGFSGWIPENAVKRSVWIYLN